MSSWEETVMSDEQIDDAVCSVYPPYYPEREEPTLAQGSIEGQYRHSQRIAIAEAQAEISFKAGYEERELVEVPLADLLEKSYKVGKEEVLREILSRMQEALRASTHDANDYNCADWPPGEGCSGCKGDEVRKQAIEWLATLAERMEIK